MITRQAIVNALHALGDTPDEVADTLRACDCTGDPRDSTACPVARKLRRQLRERVDVCGQFVRVKCLADDPGADAWVRVPAAVAAFVERFDAGEYPDLVTPEGVPT